MNTRPSDPYKAYSRATHTVGKTKQVVMLYDGAIRFMQQAKVAIQEKRIEDRFKLVNKVCEIVLGLQSCLDFEHGGEAARVLYDFYSSLDTRLIGIHRSNSLEVCDEVIDELKRMRDVWSQIDQGETLASPQPESATGQQPQAVSAGDTPRVISA